MTCLLRSVLSTLRVHPIRKKSGVLERAQYFFCRGGKPRRWQCAVEAHGQRAHGIDVGFEAYATNYRYSIDDAGIITE